MTSRRLLPLLPLRDIIVFPSMVVPLFVGRDKSIRALEHAMHGAKEIVLAAQKQSKTNDPGPQDIYSVGTIGKIVQLLRLPDGTVKVLVEGKRRARVHAFVQQEALFEVEAEPIQTRGEPSSADEELIRTVRSAFEAYVKLNKRMPPEMLSTVAKIDDPARLADTIVAQLSIKLGDKQTILETIPPRERLETLLQLMRSEIELQRVEQDIRSRVKKQMERTQRDFYKNSRRDKSSSENSDEPNEVEELAARIADKELPDAVQERLEKEIRKLKMMSPMSAEATVARNYVERVLALPWFELTEDRLNIDEAEEQLQADHYGLDKPKERILEYLAVQSLVETPRGPILCFVGPPGVGKTSLGRSIAQATNRNFVRLSLGGVRDEAEIRGHRRTYIGSMPGKIIQSLEKAGSKNPVFLLDEIDKMSADFRGDPSSAMLEVLDPEQNETFNDHYLDLDFDLSKVMFICTANDLGQIPPPLRDRMEIIQIAGYTDQEKLQIARRYLVPKQLEANGVHDVDVHFTSSALQRIVSQYTREAGVRNLEREVGSVCRKVARKVVQSDKPKDSLSFKVNARAVPHYLGPPRHKRSALEQEDHIGVTNGMAWTQFGGVMLAAEATMMPGTGKIIITGKLGDVMQESARAAISYVRSKAYNLGLNPAFHQKVDIHVHFPEGALPKDGPSAGVTMVTSVVSALTQLPVRHEVAMTGEITLRGRVLPVGGVKEKVIAAHRAGAQKILLPRENRKDLRDIPRSVRSTLDIELVHHIDEVLRHALALEQPDAFMDRLSKPILPPDVLWRDDADSAENNLTPTVQVDDPSLH